MVVSHPSPRPPPLVFERGLFMQSLVSQYKIEKNVFPKPLDSPPILGKLQKAFTPQTASKFGFCDKKNAKGKCVNPENAFFIQEKT